MYNRYVPQPDGTFRKTKLPEPEGSGSMPRQESPPFIPCAERAGETPIKDRSCGLGIGSFFKNLFPQGLDVEDLIVILLLLLLSQDGGKNGNRALLTLGAYLFL